MKNVTVALKDIVVDRSLNPRRDYDETGLNKLAQSIKMQGLLHPPTIISIPKGHAGKGQYLLIAGFRRFAALQKNGVETADFRFAEGATLEDGLCLNASENLARKNISRFELAGLFCSMIKDHKMSAATIASKIRGEVEAGVDTAQPMSEGNIEHYARLYNGLCPAAKKAWAEQAPKATITNLLRIVPIKDHAAQAKAWENIVAGRSWDDNGTAEAANGGTPPAPVTRATRPSAKALKEQIKAVKDNEDLDEEWKEGAVLALRWAVGEVKTMKGITPDAS